MANFFLWGGVTAFIALPSIPVFAGLTFAGLLMIIGFVLLVLGK